MVDAAAEYHAKEGTVKEGHENITVCPHPLYSPDLAPRNFWFFPKDSITMKG